ncbi:MAG: Qat anti-phage system associated protein QatB, partial [Georgfuchsia sp.]
MPFDPPWLNDIPVGGEGEGTDGDGGTGQPAAPIAPQTPGVAPPKRFQAARQSLGAFARNGDTQALGRAAGHYSRTGMGGAGAVAVRMRTSTKAAAGLGSFLQAARERSDPTINLWIDVLRATNPSAQTVIDAVVTQILPEGGSVDEESAKDSMAQALSELIQLDPDADLLALQDAQIWTLMQLYLGHEACNRMYADIGQLFESARFDPATIVHRTNEMRSFLKNSVAVQLETVR